MAAVPPVLWFMRRRMRGHRGKLSMPQFRALVRVEREPSVSVTEVAEHVGLSLSTMSRVVSGLVDRGYLARDTSGLDRRRVVVAITPKGKTVLQDARAQTRRELEEVLAPLDSADQTRLSDAMRILRRLFDSADGTAAASAPTNGAAARNGGGRKHRGAAVGGGRDNGSRSHR